MATPTEPISAEPPLCDLSLPIEGMTCASCVGRVERVLGRIPGVKEVRVNLATERADLRLLPSVARSTLVQAVQKAGYGVGPEPQPEANVERSSNKIEERAERLLARVRVAAGFSLPVFVLEMGGHMIPSVHHWVMHTLGRDASWSIQLLLTTLVMALPGREIFIHGWRALVRGNPDMNSLVALGTSSAYGYSVAATTMPWLLTEQTLHVYYEAAAVVITLILLGRYLEAKAKGRTSEAIGRLLKLSPEIALVKRGDQWVEEHTAKVLTGDVLLLKPGARIPVDGSVIEGQSRVDESMLTGEPIPVQKTPGASLRAGTINQAGSLTMRATAVGSHTLLAQIVRMVEQAQASKLPIQALVDRVTSWFVPVVMSLAALTFAVWYLLGPEPSMALVNAVGVLIIACPCAMGLATPTSILVGTGRGAELGLLFRHGEALQRLAETKIVAMDKTGTLTLGHPQLTDWFTVPGFDERSVLRDVAALEVQSEHPIARAIVQAAQQRGLILPTLDDFVAEVGFGVSGGVECRRIVVGSPRYFERLGIDGAVLASHVEDLGAQGKTTLVVAVDGVAAAALAVSDPIKPAARAAVEQLKRLGIQVAMITGDNLRTARAVAQRLGIEHVVAEVLPAGKVAALTELKKRYGTTAFVGDGINDAPVLAEADVGIAMGAGTDVAIEAAQVVLMRDDLTSVPTAVTLSRATLRNIRQNLFWAFAYNAALIPIAAGALYPKFGILLSPVFGALAMAMSSVFVVGNALRLRRFEPRVLRLGRTESEIQGGLS